MWAEAYARRTAGEQLHYIAVRVLLYAGNLGSCLTCNRLHKNLIERLNFVKKKLEGGSSDEEDEDENDDEGDNDDEDEDEDEDENKD